jgi:hypothetical protein
MYISLSLIKAIIAECMQIIFINIVIYVVLTIKMCSSLARIRKKEKD